MFSQFFKIDNDNWMDDTENASIQGYKNLLNRKTPKENRQFQPQVSKISEKIIRIFYHTFPINLK